MAWFNAASNGAHKLSYGEKYEKLIAADSPSFQPVTGKRFEFLSHGAAEDLLYASHCASVVFVTNCASCTSPVPVA